MKYIYTKNVILLLLLSVINYHTYAAEPTIICSFKATKKTLGCTPSILMHAQFFKDFSSNNGLSSPLPITEVSYENFCTIYQAMEYISQKKTTEIPSLYNNTELPKLVSILKNSNYLHIPCLEEILHNIIVNKCNTMIQDSPTKQLVCLTTIKTLTAEVAKQVINKIPSLFFESIVTKISKTPPALSPGNTYYIKNTNLTFDIIRYSDQQKIATILNFNGLPYETFRFSSQDKFLLYCTDKKELGEDRHGKFKGWICKLINIATQEETTIKKVIWSNNHAEGILNIDNNDIIAQFSPDEKYLLIRTYDTYCNGFQNPAYQVFSTTSLECVREINDNNTDYPISEISFCDANILCIKKKHRSSDNGSCLISFIDIVNASIETQPIKATRCSLNKNKDTLIYCSDGSYGQTIIRAYNIVNKNNKKKTFKIPSNEITFDNNPQNNFFLFYHNKDNTRVYRILIYDNQQNSFKKINFQPPLYNISIKWAEKNNDFLITGKQSKAKNTNNLACNDKTFVYDSTTNMYVQIASSDQNASNLTYTFIPNTTKILCEYPLKSYKTPKIYDINSKSDITLPCTSNKHDTITVHPTQPLIYIVSSLDQTPAAENQSIHFLQPQNLSEQLTIYNCETLQELGSYTTQDMGGFQTITNNYLSQDGRLLILCKPDTYQVINTTTQQEIQSFNKNEIDTISWRENVLRVVYQKSNEVVEITFNPIESEATLHSKKSTAQNLTSSEKPITKTETVTSNDNKALINNKFLCGGISITAFIVILYTCYPHLLKNLFQLLKIC